MRKHSFTIKSKFRFITFIILTVIISVSATNAVLGYDNAIGKDKVSYVTVEICYGDTLWEIAKDYINNDTDPRDAIYEICKINNITASDIYPGMEIQIPRSF